MEPIVESIAHVYIGVSKFLGSFLHLFFQVLSYGFLIRVHLEFKQVRIRFAFIELIRSDSRESIALFQQLKNLLSVSKSCDLFF